MIMKFIGALGVGATLLGVGFAMRAMSKASEKKQPFFKDENPTREFKPPFLGAAKTKEWIFATPEDWQAWREKYAHPADIQEAIEEADRLTTLAKALPSDSSLNWSAPDVLEIVRAREAIKEAAHEAHLNVILLSGRRYIRAMDEASKLGRRGLEDDTPGPVIQRLIAEEDRQTKDVLEHLDSLADTHSALMNQIR